MQAQHHEQVTDVVPVEPWTGVYFQYDHRNGEDHPSNAEQESFPILAALSDLYEAINAQHQHQSHDRLHRDPYEAEIQDEQKKDHPCLPPHQSDPKPVLFSVSIKNGPLQKSDGKDRQAPARDFSGQSRVVKKEVR